MLRELARSLSPCLLLCSGVMLWPSRVSAYCQTRSCDPATEVCPRDLHGCITTGELLSWPGGETEMWLDPEGSLLWNISAGDAQTALANAIDHWTSVICPDGKPVALTVDVKGILTAPATDDDNILSFLDEGSPYAPGIVGQTRIRYRGPALERANIELNSQYHEFALTPVSSDQVDLEAVLTHELGHFLGLDHTDVAGATMQPETMGFGSLDLRSLEQDDIEGICAIYGQGVMPEAPATETPATADSGCSASSRASQSHGLPYLVLAGLSFAWRGARSRERRRART